MMYNGMMEIYRIYVFGDADNCIEDVGGGWGLFISTDDLRVFNEYLQIALETYHEEDVEWEVERRRA